MYTSKHFNFRCTGLSFDKRTNSWEFTCLKCNKSFKPKTTMLTTQIVECPKCKISETINYNNY